MMSYMEYKMITNVPFSRNIYELWKRTGAPSYSSAYNLAKKLEHEDVIRIEEKKSNGRTVSSIQPAEAYSASMEKCNSDFNQYYSRATDILKQKLDRIAKEMGLTYQIIGGQLDPSRAFADIQIAIPEKEESKWKSAFNKIERYLNYVGLTTKPSKKNKFLARKLHAIPLPFINPDAELKERLENKTIRDIHYHEGYAELEPYFIYLKDVA